MNWHSQLTDFSVDHLKKNKRVKWHFEYIWVKISQNSHFPLIFHKCFKILFIDRFEWCMVVRHVIVNLVSVMPFSLRAKLSYISWKRERVFVFFRRKNRHKINRNLCLQAKLTIKQRRVKRTENNSKNTLIAMNLHIYSYNCLKTSIQQTSLSADFMTKIYKYSKRKIDKILNGTRGKINYKFIYG